MTTVIIILIIAIVLLLICIGYFIFLHVSNKKLENDLKWHINAGKIRDDILNKAYEEGKLDELLKNLEEI